jgi:eukaryotic-like serine/threonine-protein kinase
VRLHHGQSPAASLAVRLAAAGRRIDAVRSIFTREQRERRLDASGMIGAVSAEAEEQFHQRWTALGLAETAVGFPVDSTISPLTLPLAGVPTEPLDDRTSSLPRIFVEIEPGSRPASSTAADLALVSTLGEGGMGRVHLAQQHSLVRQVAVKMLKEDASPQLERALVDEARLTGALEHPGVIPVHALGLDEHARPLLVMKKIEGVDLRTLLADSGHPLWNARKAEDRLTAGIEILMQVCQSVEFAHSRGIVHLDIKPENVMVGGCGEVYLVDWGIAKRLAGGSARHAGLVGTPAYMAPEMALGGALDPRTDVYLLGATLHELLTGSFRHDGVTLESVLLAAALSKPPSYDASVPEALADLAQRATNADPSRRPPSAQAFREELAAFLRARSATRLSETASERLARLEELLEQSGQAPPNDLAAAYRLATEARFGFTQSLDQQAGLRLAERGRVRCIELSIELELRQEHVETARALLREIDRPDPDLVGRIEAAEARVRERLQESDRLRALERDLDPAGARRPRVKALAALGCVIALLAATSTLLARGGRPASAFGMLLVGIAIAVAAVVAGALMHKQVLTTSFNRRLAGLLAVAIWGAVLHRLVGVIFDLPVDRLLSQELLLFAGLAAAGATTLVPRLWWGTIVLLLGFVSVEGWPEQALNLFAVSNIVNIAIMVWALWRHGRPARVLDERPS